MQDFEEKKKGAAARLVEVYHETPLMRGVAWAILFGICVGVLWVSIFAAPLSFPSPAIIHVKDGATISSVGQDLQARHLVRSRFVFTSLIRLLGGSIGVVAGDYYFPASENAFTVALRLAEGDFELDPVKVTIPEGSTVKDIGRILGDKLQFFDTETFLKLATGKEGYLFPDTYFFLPSEDPAAVIKVMENTFYKRTADLRTQLSASGHSLNDLVIMASLLEKEARTLSTRKMIAGILWKRISKGMYLQVDATFPYFINKNTFTVTKADLRIDSPYNTYTHKGLPIGPIANPGLSSLDAALHPTVSAYLFYLSDMNGNMHYSKTYAEHLRKIQIYLK